MKEILNSTQIFIDKVATGKLLSNDYAIEYSKIINESEKSYYHILRKKLIPVGNNAEYRCFIQKFNQGVYENGLDYQGKIVKKGMEENLKQSIQSEGDIIVLWNPKQPPVIDTVEFDEPLLTTKKLNKNG
jgi:hypothetical protein